MAINEINDIGQLIETLSNKELIIRLNMKKSLVVSKFKLGSMEIEGELGISFRDIVNEIEKEENTIDNIEINTENEKKEENNEDSNYVKLEDVNEDNEGDVVEIENK